MNQFSLLARIGDKPGEPEGLGRIAATLRIATSSFDSNVRVWNSSWTDLSWVDTKIGYEQKFNIIMAILISYLHPGSRQPCRQSRAVPDKFYPL